MDGQRVGREVEPRLGSAEGEFADRVRPHVIKMRRLARRLAGHADGDDVVQEALARAWIKHGQFDPRRGSLSTWLLAITADQAYKAWRRRGRTGTLRGAEEQRSHEDRLDLHDALRALSDRQRLAVDCYYFVGLTVVETAGVMRCSEGTVKSTLSDARTVLRKQLVVPS